MVFMYSERIADRMIVEPGGVWLDRSGNEPHLWLVAKLPMNLIREMDVGAPIVLRAWVVESEGHLFAAFGFLVYEDPVYPMAIYGVCRSAEEIADLGTLLGMESFPLQVHNENGLPLLHAQCRITPSEAAGVRDALPSGPYPAGNGVALRREARDIVEASLEPDAALDARIKATCVLPVAFTRTEKLSVEVIGSGQVTLADADQGKELEWLTFQQLDNLFTFGAYHSPERIHSTKGRLEVCDVLALSRIRENPEEGIFVIQNKVATAYADGLKRTTKRRGLKIQGNILEALGQTVGAIEKLKDGVQVYHHAGDRIEVDLPQVAAAVEQLDLSDRANKVGHGIVVISDMHEGVDWEEIWKELLEACRKTRYTFHVLDLRELHNLVVNARGSPALFESFFVARWQRMAELKSANVRFEFKA